MFNKVKKVVFIIKEDEGGFTLSTRLKGKVTMDHFRAIAGYTSSKYNEYASKINKLNREARRAKNTRRG